MPKYLVVSVNGISRFDDLTAAIAFVVDLCEISDEGVSIFAPAGF